MIEVTERPKAADVPVADLNRTIDCFAKQTYVVPEELRILAEEDVDGDFMELCAKAAEGLPALDYSSFSSLFGMFRILSQKDGDRRVVWCRRVIKEIKAAKKMFMDLLSKGMVPYKVGVDGKASVEVMDEFDPCAEEVIFMPVQAIRGG